MSKVVAWGHNKAVVKQVGGPEARKGRKRKRRLMDGSKAHASVRTVCCARWWADVESMPIVDGAEVIKR